ncbi:MAG: hypothetical protein M1383_04120, partial [Patescibacteria group bacterium]|nr:hypothetical protein [Patescibacteria group bacterium]
KFGLIPNTGDEEWYRELFRKGETQPEDKVLGWYSGNHKTSVPGVSLVLWKFRQRKSEWGLENLPDANKPLNVSAILMSLDKKLIEEMVKTENQTAAQNVTGTPAVESADLLDF